MRLIDADALEEVLGKIPAADIKNIDGQAYTLVRLSQVFNVIEHAPTIEERKEGKWKMVLTRDAIGFNTVRFCCSECNGMDYGTPPFCRMCGAEMEGAEPEDIPMEYFESGGR